jgi:hypothetical protein
MTPYQLEGSDKVDIVVKFTFSKRFQKYYFFIRGQTVVPSNPVSDQPLCCKHCYLKEQLKIGALSMLNK